MKIMQTFLSRQFLLFLLFGGCAAFVSILAGWLLYHNEQGWLPYPLAVSIGAAFAIIVNFGLNYAFNFHFRGRTCLAQFQTFTGVALIGVLLTAFLAWIFLKFMLSLGFTGWSIGNTLLTAKFSAHILSVGMVTIYSFLAHKFLSFNIGFSGWLKKKISNPK